MEQTLKRTTTTKAELIELGKQAIEELAKLEAITDIEFMMNRKHHSSSVAVVIFLYNEKTR
ncbi:MAG: hypothetical protein IPL26_10990 [Leptospiraceae bacterium]|nr:hypothetical protein [Leptospiraceae bacterium]